MLTLPEKVYPGEKISSDLMNAVLAELKRLQRTSVQGGTQAVPNVLGAFLRDAITAITIPSRQLSMGFVLDVTGATVDPHVSSNLTLVVLNQSPVGDQRVAPSTPVNLIVSGSIGVSTPPVNPPTTISRTETATGTVATSFRVGEAMVLVGTNFRVTTALNTITFNGQPAVNISNDLSDATRRLNLIVPTGIAGAPVNPGDAALAGVVLSITTPGNSPVTTTVTVTAPSGLAQPSISGFTPGAQFEGAALTINGTNFSTVITRNQVMIGGTVANGGLQATVTSATATQLVVTVPQFSNLTPGQSGLKQVSVSTLDASGTVIGTAIFSSSLSVFGA